MTVAKRMMQPEDLYRVRNLTDPVLSPDDSRVAWVESVADESSDRLRSSIWVAPSDGSAPPTPFTEGPGDNSPRWSPDGRYLAYVSVSPDAMAELRLAPLSGGVPRALGKFSGPVSQPAWSPDSSRVVVVSPTGTSRPAAELSPVERNEARVVRGLAARYDNVGWFDGRRHLFVVDVATGAARQLTNGDHDDVDPSWSADGQTIAFASDRDPQRDDRQLRSDLFVVPAGGGRARRLTSGGGRVSAPAFSPDGARIAFVGHEGGRSWNRDAHVFVLPADGSSAPETVAPATDRPVVSMLWAPPPFRWVSDDEIAMIVMDHGSVVLHAARLSDSKSRVVVGGDRQIDSFSVSSDRRTVVFTSVWPDSPPECYAAQLRAPGAGGMRGASALRQISRANEALLSEIALGAVERATVVTDDGTEIEYFTIAPPGRSQKPLPVHLDIHGGPHGAWPAGRFLPFHQTVAAAGYLVLLPNPRGSSSYGQAFTEACTGDWGGADAADIGACVDDVIARGLGDEHRLFVGGGSYGGFMTAWLVGHTKRFKAATAMAAVIDQASMIGTSDIPGFVEFNFGRLWEHTHEYERRSPLTYARDITTPVLILHWEGDLRVPISQGEELFAALRILKRPVEFVRYPGGSHVARAPSQNIDWVRRLLAWNERHDPRSAKGRRRRT
jgi:dipeptidyl aminopeptidase/acylaminoacyl peptidase